MDSRPVKVETYWDRHTRSYITMLVDENGYQFAHAQFDGDKTGRNASVRHLNWILEQPDRIIDYDRHG